VLKLLQDVATLLQPSMESIQISVEVVPESLEIFADRQLIDQVFIPFFTTKRDGSGIGLSLSRQIMTAHKGDIALESSPAGTTFRLVFQ